MARPLRIEYPGAIYHITSRGNARRPIYKEDKDRETFQELLGSVVSRYGWICHAYCLMGNHYHQKLGSGMHIDFTKCSVHSPKRAIVFGLMRVSATTFISLLSLVMSKKVGLVPRTSF